MFGKNSKAGKESKKGRLSTKSKNVEASTEATTKGCSSKSNSSTKNCK